MRFHDGLGTQGTALLKLHELKLKLAANRQLEVDGDIANNVKQVSIQTDKDQLQTALGIWKHFKSSISSDGCSDYRISTTECQH